MQKKKNKKIEEVSFFCEEKKKECKTETKEKRSSGEKVGTFFFFGIYSAIHLSTAQYDKQCAG